VFKILAGLLLFVAAGIAIILGLLRIEHAFAVELPAPTGSFPVGRVSYHWIDPARIDALAPISGQKRELIVWIWYPADAGASSEPAEYLPAVWRDAVTHEQGSLMSNYLTRDLALVRSHSFADAEIAHAQRTYPVVIMKSGVGALATDYTTLAEDLASHGYVVIGSDSPHSTFVVVFPDGRIAKRTPAGNPPENLAEQARRRVANEAVKVWSADTRFELDQLERMNAPDSSSKFAGRLDLASVGIFGHSFGGATAAQFCHEDSRCKAGIDIDGNPFGSVIDEGLTQPFLYLLSDHSNEKGEESRQILANIHSICESDKAGCQIATIRGSRHFNFSDMALLKEHSIGRAVGLLGPIDRRRGLRITADVLSAFFGRQRKPAPGTLNDLSKQYPELVFDAK